MCIHLGFDFEKAVQALNFFAEKSGGAINKMKAIKLVYFADRYHLRKFGRPITNDEYFALPYGPVNSGVKDLAEMSGFLSEREKDYAAKFIEAPNRYEVKSVENPDLTVFSESDQEALLFAWQKFGRYDQFELVDISHEYPEWKKHKQSLESRTNSRVRMDYLDFIEDPPGGFEECHSLTPDDKEDRLEEMREIAKLEALWS